MRHRVAGRRLGRTSAHREALLRNLSTALFDKERITTTLAKAKELRPYAEKIVTLSKRETLHARRQVLRRIHDKKVVAKLFDSISARFAQRPGGYTRILRLGPRRGDNAELAIVELVEAEASGEKAASGTKRKTAKKTSRAGKKKAAAKSKPARAKKAAPAKGEGKKSAGKSSTGAEKARKSSGSSSKKSAAKTPK